MVAGSLRYLEEGRAPQQGATNSLITQGVTEKLDIGGEKNYLT